jgi:hypothetical protein
VATARRVTPVQATSALQILAELMARLVVVPGPEGLRHLADIAAAMLDQVPGAVSVLRDPAEQPLVLTCASAVVELIDEPGDRLLQWDLHYDNILAGQREPCWPSATNRLPATRVSTYCRTYTTGGTGVKLSTPFETNCGVSCPTGVTPESSTGAWC